MPDNHETLFLETTEDADLVAASRAGDREAFGRIVERYQRLLCSLAYSATGSFSESEDLAQDTFVEAWRGLHSLREPAKLRSWLCGILRHKISRLRRSAGLEPVRQAEDLEIAEDLPSTDRPAVETAINQEEQAILWKALERVPQLYREPLVLYYRENRSIEHVAASLDLTEDAVKQRLSRGRRILQEQVAAFVEGALSRSTPGRVFTLGVMAALPSVTPPAKAAGLGATLAPGAWMAKGYGLAALLSSASGLVSAVMALRAHLDQTRTPRERRAVVRITVALFVGTFAWLAALYLVRAAALRWPDLRVPAAWLAQGLTLSCAITWPVVVLRIMRTMRALRSQERRHHPDLFQDPRDQAGSTAGAYRSRWTLLGVPLIHLRFASPSEGEGPVFGWIAGGDRAYGLLFAWGGLAVAPISVGAVAVGVLTVGTVGFGVIGLGTIGVGIAAMGCAAIGIDAGGWLSALGWDTAQGSGFAIARHAALGSVAFAAHANDAVAQATISGPNRELTQTILFSLIAALTLVPVTLYTRAVRRRLG